MTQAIDVAGPRDEMIPVEGIRLRKDGDGRMDLPARNELMPTAPIPVYLAHPTAKTSGDSIRWSAGQKATFDGNNGPQPVTIITGERVGHAAAPGVACMEVAFEAEGGTAYCVPTHKLRLR